MITKAQQAVADIAAQGNDGFADRVELHANRLHDDGDIVGLVEFTEALVLFSQVCREAAERRLATEAAERGKEQG